MKARDRTNNFPLLRLAAALAAALASALLLTGEPASGLGSISVAVFFVVAGFLTTRSQESTRSTPRFLVKRFLRLYPALLACLLFCALALGAAVTVLPIADYYRQEGVARFVIMNLLAQVQFDTLPTVIFTAGGSGDIVDGALRPLPDLLILYGLVALLGRVGWLRPPIIALLWLLGIAGSLYDYEQWRSLAGAFPVLLGCFAAGMAMCKLRGDWLSDRRLATVAAIGVAIAAGMHVAAALFPIFGAYLVIHIALDPRLPRVDAAKYGELSFGLYLYAWPVQQTILWLVGGGLPWWALFLMALPPAAALAFVSWHVVERPALGFKPRPAVPARAASARTRRRSA